MGWEIKTLKKYFEQKFELIDKALELAREQMNWRLDGMNNIHQQLVKQNETFVSKDELKLLEQKLESLAKLVYIGLGIFLVIQIILTLVMTKIL